MKLGLFFGAGAEMGYGLPSGGKFALELFRNDPSKEKKKLRLQLQEGIGRTDSYATDWLPDAFWSKNIHAFGKTEFGSLIESSIEYRKEELIDRLDSFDEMADKTLESISLERKLVEDVFRKEVGCDFGSQKYSQLIKLNPLLAQKVKLFDSQFYSAALDLLKKKPKSSDLRKYVVAFLQLLVGVHGQELVNKLNQEIFAQQPDDLPIFDDVGGIFQIEFSRGGLGAIELLIEDRKTYKTDEDSSAEDIFCALFQAQLEKIFEGVLDYQSLVDSHFRYLFSPRKEWAKFTKMVIFLRTAREYIEKQRSNIDWKKTEGYYHDLEECANLGIEIEAVGTANYNSILQQVGKNLKIKLPEIHHLNGGVADYYNPYKNVVDTYEDVKSVPNDQIHVPFMLTQSGLKPLTSVGMSRRYVDLYDSFKECDAIAVVGFGFNTDDSHINGLFRELVEDEGKTIYYVTAGKKTEGEVLRQLSRNLRLTGNQQKKIKVVIVDRENRQAGKKMWLEQISDNF